MSGEPRFDEAFLGQLDELLKWRRDVRRFTSVALPEGTLARLLSVASLAPSVGLSEPWRFVTVDDPARRTKVRDSFSKVNAQALAGHAGDKAKLYASLKLEGFEAPGHVAVFCDCSTAKGSDLGRTSMPEMAEYSVVAAIQLIWMVARAQGLGLGWGVHPGSTRGDCGAGSAGLVEINRLPLHRLSGGRKPGTGIAAGGLGRTHETRRFYCGTLGAGLLHFSVAAGAAVRFARSL